MCPSRLDEQDSVRLLGEGKQEMGHTHVYQFVFNTRIPACEMISYRETKLTILSGELLADEQKVGA